ncbi:hypothetical protein T492DRAFT_519154 [Pavlovales sp. CCMP2436]|nr:hypothetical protein T492DRAFT_519154 [Pavlovales sp. CCMP2436]
MVEDNANGCADPSAAQPFCTCLTDIFLIPYMSIIEPAQVDINALDRRGSTPLQDSYRHANDECSKVLLAHGANMGTFDAAMHLCYAAAADDVDTLRRLLIHRCEVCLQPCYCYGCYYRVSRAERNRTVKKPSLVLCAL